MTTANNGATDSYTYDGDGHRVKRIVGNTETWQVYGVGGELLAEYAANAAPSSPQKEYGYRNGQVLITADAASNNSGVRTNFALTSNGASATAQNTTADYSGYTFQPWWAIDGARHIYPPGGDRYWRDEHGMPTSLEIDFSGIKTISEIDVYTVADYPGYFSEPYLSQTFTQYGVTAFAVCTNLRAVRTT